MKLKKIAIVIICSLLLLANISTVCFASESHSSEIMDFIEKEHTDTSDASEKITDLIVDLVFIARIIAICIAITILLVLAMKYMTAAPGDKADIKKSAIVYVVGAFVLFGAQGILGLIAEFATAIK